MHADTSTQPRAFLADALSVAATQLDTDRRAWVIGIAWLREAANTRTREGAAVDTILRSCREHAEFPSGAMGYVTLDGEPEVNEMFQMASMHHRLNGADYLDIRIALGAEGFIGYGFTRSGVLADHPGQPSHVLLTDVEAAIADLGTLSASTVAHLGYGGPVEVVVGVCWTGAEPLRLRALDPDTGELGECQEAPFGPVFGAFRGDQDFSSQYPEVLRMATEAARQFGMEEPQLMTARESLLVDVHEIEKAMRESPADRG